MSGYWTLTATASPDWQPGAVHLADRRRGDRLGRELGEHLGRRAPAELLAQARLDVAVGAGRNLILQPLQLLAKGVGQNVGHDADELADLDEQAAQLDDGGLESGGRSCGASPASARAMAAGAAKPPRDRQAEIRQRDLGGHEVGGEETRAAGHGRIIPCGGKVVARSRIPAANIFAVTFGR